MDKSRRLFLACAGIGALVTRFAIAAAPDPVPIVEVWKDRFCGCCGQWIAHMRAAGFTVNVHDNGNAAMRARLGIDEKFGSCHTAIVGGYAIEGHVPVREIRRLLRERPSAIGLAVPGMVPGTPGMEQGGIVEPYDVLLIAKDGTAKKYAAYRG